MRIDCDCIPYINGVTRKREMPLLNYFELARNKLVHFARNKLAYFARNKLAYFVRNKLAYFQKIKEVFVKVKDRLPKIKLGFILIIFICLAVLGGIYRLYGISKRNQSTNNKSNNNVKFSQVIPVDKTSEFPALDSQGNYRSEISLTVVSAEKTNEVMVQNKPIIAKPDRFFLIVNLELENKSTETLGLVSSDLVRLVAGENGKKVAPDLHNRQVLIAPVSVKDDRIGFVVIGSQNVPLALELSEFYKTKEVKKKIELKF